MTHPLDRPVWSALATGWAALARGGVAARRLDPDFGPFAAARDGDADAMAALAALAAPGEALWLIEPAPVVPAVMTVERRAPIRQMIADRPATAAPDGFVMLGDDDAAEMRALADLTRPGPFHALTHRLGNFIGVRENGRIAAMAGERMRCDGYAELSGVCTHPGHRGRGHARRLMQAVAARIVARGETPFLHVYPDNAGAIALYEAIGYRARADLTLCVVMG